MNIFVLLIFFIAVFYWKLNFSRANDQWTKWISRQIFTSYIHSVDLVLLHPFNLIEPWMVGEVNASWPLLIILLQTLLYEVNGILTDTVPLRRGEIQLFDQYLLKHFLFAIALEG